ncbi:MAG: hypothetical protein GX786_10650 [Clostridiales bacterium]|nr:hypothetical protein [Clostridiales bacterium]
MTNTFYALPSLAHLLCSLFLGQMPGLPKQGTYFTSTINFIFAVASLVMIFIEGDEETSAAGIYRSSQKVSWGLIGKKDLCGAYCPLC